ncbi:MULTISPECIES: DUF2267 domain-containing protein [unclassified Mesorhizobium]|uniref:DUF2267 domain-containing protein n=1 Tax=unclassified Mesorhizobium TaxID=325217 RepID=UPI00112C060F|nr:MULTISPECIES: DUF2267 domain-containing protein [unclassified Mesorhizobium]TPL02998.1 DUF2267 domain-containing protein [Mesorhizobium sp. B2-4-16]TPL73764.1 DUF2267 domain-containing protein [Mesorhizobium sp. B2-4-3]
MTHSVSHTSLIHAAEQAQQWVNELARDLDWNEQSAFRLLKSVLHALRDWLSPEEMADLPAQLPTLIRGIYFEGWNPAGPACEHKKRGFVICVRDSFGYEPEIDVDKAIGAVFRLLDRHISHGEIIQVRNSMKKSLRQLWPEG